MLTDEELLPRKKSLWEADIPGVEGVGVGSGHLIVYLHDDSQELRDRVEQTVANLAPGTPLRFVVSGSFLAY